MRFSVHTVRGSEPIATMQRAPSSKCAVACNDMAPQHASLLVAEIRAGVQGAAIIPQYEIAHTPFMRVNKLILLDMCEQLVEQHTTVFLVHALDGPGHQPIDVQCLAPSVRVSANNRLRIVRVGGKIELCRVDLACWRLIVIGV